METQLPAHPESFQLDRANRRLLVNIPDEHQIACTANRGQHPHQRCHLASYRRREEFPNDPGRDLARLFIACRKPPGLAVYDTPPRHPPSQTPCVGDADDMFYDAKLKRVYVIGGEGFLDVFQVSHTSQKPARLAPCQRLRAHEPAFSFLICRC